VSRVTDYNGGACLAWKVFQIRPGDPLAVIEVGITKPGQMRSYARFLRPDAVVVTMVGSEHHRSLGSLEAAREQKSEMVRALPASGLAVLNGDDPQVRQMTGETKARVVTFGLDTGRDVFATNIGLDWPSGTHFTIHIKGAQRIARTRLIGRHQVYGLLAAAALAAEENIPLDKILERLETVEPTPGRMQPVQHESGAIILRDEYKSTMESVEAAFTTLGDIRASRRLAVMGEIADPRGSPYPYYRMLGRLCAQVCDKVIFLGWSSKIKPITRGVQRGGGPSQLVFYAGRDVLAAVENLRSDLRAGDVVLIKGRSIQKMDRISLALLGRRVRCRKPECRFKMQDCSRCPSLCRP
jgi:UDP-N-acetylmuramyl pentapeptide synthase